jgi:MFS family permease
MSGSLKILDSHDGRADALSVGVGRGESPSPETPHVKRNYRLGIAAGSLGAVANDFIEADLILAGFIYAATGSKMLVGILAIMNKVGWLGPQLLAGSLLEHRKDKMSWYVGATVIRAFALALMTASIFKLAGGVGASAMTVFMLSYLVMCVCGGFTYVITMDMMGRMIPSEMLGRFLGVRNFGGQAIAIVAGIFVIQPILGKGGNYSYFVLAVIGSVLVIISMVLMGLCKDHEHKTARRPSGLLLSLRRGFKWMRLDRNYRLFVWQRVMFRFEYIGLAFFIPYGKDVLMRESTANIAILGGVMVATMKASRIIASLMWAKTMDPRKCKICLIFGGAGFAIASTMALVAPVLPAGYHVELPMTGLDLTLPLTIYLLALAILGLGNESMFIGGDTFVMTSAPAHRRLSYVAFTNTVTSPLTLLPLAAAWMANVMGVTSLFVIVLVSGIITAWLAGKMDAGSGKQARGKR